MPSPEYSAPARLLDLQHLHWILQCCEIAQPEPVPPRQPFLLLPAPPVLLLLAAGEIRSETPDAQPFPQQSVLVETPHTFERNALSVPNLEDDPFTKRLIPLQKRVKRTIHARWHDD